ncbi:MAG: hypothetical protein ACD_50C00337G0005 [uncultured bacterium]|nr:MAG: hypothetical protein ACD_50C00337G0005 [uncultured bacterium]
MKQTVFITFSIIFSFSLAYTLLSIYAFLVINRQDSSVGSLAYLYWGPVVIAFITIILTPVMYSLLSQKNQFVAKSTTFLGGFFLLYTLYQIIIL